MEGGGEARVAAQQRAEPRRGATDEHPMPRRRQAARLRPHQPVDELAAQPARVTHAGAAEHAERRRRQPRAVAVAARERRGKLTRN